MLDPAARSQVGEECPDQVRVEMVAVADEEWEIGGRKRRQSLACEPRRNEERIRVGRNIAAGPTRTRRIEETALSEAIDIGREGVEVAFESRLLRPSGEFDARLVGRVAARHPIGFRNADLVEES